MKFLKKHRKGLIVFVVLAALVTGGVLWLRASLKKGMEIINSTLATETALAEKRSLVSVVSATGKITSVAQKDVSSIATGAKILKVNVQIGDMVNEGDVLVELDPSNYEDSLASAKDSLSTAEKSSSLTVSSAQRRVNETIVNNNISDAKYEEQVKEAKEKMEMYEGSKKYAENMYTEAYKNMLACENNYKSANNAIAAAKKAWTEAADAWTEAKAALEALPTDPTDPEYDPAAIAAAEAAKATTQAAEAAAKTAYDAAIARYDITILSSALETAKSAVNKWLADISSYTASYEQYKATLENLEKTRADAKRANDSTLATTKDSLKSAQLSAENSTATMEKQVSALEDQIEACTIKAPISGVVTTLNVAEGNTYAGMNSIVLEDISSFEITTEIDEYDIGKIKPGQRVVFKTNGTGDAELDGVVKSVAPRASIGMGTSVTYKVVISVLSENEYLKLDMTAKISIVLAESKDGLTVPYDAVITDDDGKEYVNVVDGKNEDGTNITHKVYVETGIKSSYYTEIYGEGLVPGTEVEIKRQSSDVFDFSSFFRRAGNEARGM